MKQTRTVTYRRWGVPAVILEGKWLTKKYGWTMGDQIDVNLQPEGILLTKIEKIKSTQETKNSPKGAPGTDINTSSVASPLRKSTVKNHGNKPTNQPAEGER